MMNVMNYKGYTAKIEFDPRDNIFWGKVLAIRDSITFEGSTVAELTADFHNAVDFYLADCTARGRSPQKPVSDKLLLRVPRRSTVPPWQPPRLPEPVSTNGPPRRSRRQRANDLLPHCSDNLQAPIFRFQP